MNMQHVQETVPYLQNKLADCIWPILGNQNKYVPLKFHLLMVMNYKRKIKIKSGNLDGGLLK